MFVAKTFKQNVEMWMGSETRYQSLIDSFKDAYRICMENGGAKARVNELCLLELFAGLDGRHHLDLRRDAMLQQFKNIINCKSKDKEATLHSFYMFFRRVIDYYNVPSEQSVREISLMSWMLNPELYVYFNSEKIIAAAKEDTPNIKVNDGKIYRESIINLVYNKYQRILREIDVQAIEMLKQQAQYELSKGVVNTVFSDFIGSPASGNNVSTKREVRQSALPVRASDSQRPHVTGGCNVVLYGVPGCGKSFIINKALQKEIENERVTRIIFHQEYSYYDFVGQMVPDCNHTNGQSKFTFKEGPLAVAIRNAYGDPDNMHYLIIEEINRGNSAAIFGDLFQLLDRDETGRSIFEVSNRELAEYVYSNPDDKNPPESRMPMQVYIPSNLTIVATMNTADQNVCPLDTAFQRRWHMLFINNDFNGVEPGIQKQCDAHVLDTGVSWKKFCEVINEKILIDGRTVRSTEDKCLGVFFMRAAYFSDEATESLPGIIPRFADNSKVALFVGKVIKYLWDDVFRLSRNAIFEDAKFDDVVQKFSTSQGSDRFNIFKQEIREKLKDDEAGRTMSHN